MPLIFPSNTLSAGGFSVDNSCRFNDDDTASMSRSVSASPTNADICTISCWVKRGNLVEGAILGNYASANFRAKFGFDGNDKLEYHQVNDGSVTCAVTTDMVFRDCNAWYHLVCAVDTTDGTAGDRIKIYVNGTQVDVTFATEIAQNLDFKLNQASISLVVGQDGNDAKDFDGYISELVLIDGQQLTATSFGEFDEDSPTIWKPIDVSGLTFGDDGFYLDFEDSADLGADVSGNSNDFTTSGLAATDQATDTPTNNFCVMNPLAASSYSALSEGNTQTAGDSASDNGNVISTFVPSNGKWYCESLVETGLPTGYPAVGLAQASDANFGTVLNSTVGVAGYDGSTAGVLRPDGQKYSNNSTASWTSTTFDTDDILMMAMDCDNGAFYIGKNDVWMESGDPTSGASKTGAFLTWTPASETGQAFASKDYNTSVLQWNFGNPTFAITSGNADADGYGNFEYAVPSGYYALCTKNLGAYGG